MGDPLPPERNPLEVRSKTVEVIAHAFQGFVESIKPPFMKLLVTLVFAALIALFFLKGCAHILAGYYTLIALVFLCALLAFVLEFREKQIDRLKREREELKGRLRTNTRLLQQCQRKLSRSS